MFLGWVLRSMFKYWRQILKVFQYIAGKGNPEWTEITADELYEKMELDLPALLIDVRSEEEYKEGYGHIQGARWIPMLELESHIEELEEYRDKEIVTMCPGGGLSLVAVDILQEAGFSDVKSLKGGTEDWHQKGYPMVKG
jgi:rhodanese-related sulfurtransferase